MLFEKALPFLVFFISVVAIGLMFYRRIKIREKREELALQEMMDLCHEYDQHKNGKYVMEVTQILKKLFDIHRISAIPMILGGYHQRNLYSIMFFFRWRHCTDDDLNNLVKMLRWEEIQYYINSTARMEIVRIISMRGNHKQLSAMKKHRRLLRRALKELQKNSKLHRQIKEELEEVEIFLEGHGVDTEKPAFWERLRKFVSLKEKSESE